MAHNALLFPIVRDHGGTVVYPTESLQLADEIYPVEGFSLKDILNRITLTGAVFLAFLAVLPVWLL